MSQVVTFIILALYIYTIVSTILVILLENRNPVRSFTWLLVLVFIPVLGLILYLGIGRNYRKNKIFSKNAVSKLTHRPVASFDIKELEGSNIDADHLSLIKLLYNNNNAATYANSKIDVYSDGEVSFEAMFEAINGAKDHIHVDFFIVRDDNISNLFRELLIKKSKEGVRVRMIYDYWGSFQFVYKKKYIKTLKEAGVYVHPFIPLGMGIFRSKINHRNHRKILIIDGKTGFTGGLNIADRYIYGDSLGKWRDTFIRVEGAAVHGLQMLFLIDWHFVDTKLVTDVKYFPKPQKHETNIIQTVASGPDTDWAAIMQGIASAIMTADKYVYIQTPYFIPTEVILNCVQIAALSGIDVRLMVPKDSDTRFTQIGTMSYLGEVMEAGVRVFRYTGGFLHSKAIVVDDFISIIGSCNMDERSYTQNFEANVFIYERATAGKLKELFLKDMQQCEELTLEEWNKHKKLQKLKESFVRLFSPML
ncbi:MAG: cardiolipin synthase [Prevotellaceae bacterium]|jgi:cardiolipin synthase|nr:cardiolipin synthase [Prevotellaceae bacterium]